MSSSASSSGASRRTTSAADPAALAEWNALVACAKPVADSKSRSVIFNIVDWPALLALAEEHGVTQLLAAAAQKLPSESVPADVRQTLAERQRAQLFFTLRISAELFRLAERFTAQSIGVMVVKGPALAMQGYGDAAMRTYGDLDMLVRHADIARATQLMIDAGYQPQIPLTAIAQGKIPGQYMFRQPEAKLLVELHNDRTMRYYPRPLPIEDLFARSVQIQMDGREIPAPAIEDHLILICIHGAKHFWERLMWIADVAALIARHPQIRWTQALQAAKDLGAESMLHGGLLLAVNVLQSQLPAEILALATADAAARSMTKQVLQWLPATDGVSPGLLKRGLFRMHMRGGPARGTGYFLRLLFSPTEEDWDANATGSRGVVDVLKRPFRLAKKHGLGGKD
jgi:Uncharacterised nucleotidyltransferase